MDDFKAGFISGMVGTLIGHPFDSIKIHSQIYRHKSNIMSLKLIIKNFGWKGLYNGIMSPLLSRSIIKGSLFTTYEQTLKILSKSHIPNYINMSIAGSISGITCTFISTPIEFIKIRNQLGHKLRDKFFKSGFQGLNLGFKEALMRDCLYYSIYFPMYNYLKKNEVPLAGGFAGSISWILVYPMDVLKSRKQSSDLIKIDGKWYHGLYKGLLPTMLRAFPVHYISLTVYDLLKGK